MIDRFISILYVIGAICFFIIIAAIIILLMVIPLTIAFGIAFILNSII